jgi:hypothetical protein
MVVLYTPPAEESVSNRGLTLGVRVGVGFPGGSAVAPVNEVVTGGTSSGALGDVVGVLIPVTFDIGYRLSPHWYVGAYLGVAYGTGANCAETGEGAASCYETDIRLGLDVQYRFFPSSVFQPWVGVGAGWEVLNQISTDDQGDEESGSLNGVELAHIDVGADFRLGSPTYAPAKLGPYFETTFGEYAKGYVHEWYTVGLRFHYDTNLLAHR